MNAPMGVVAEDQVGMEATLVVEAAVAEVEVAVHVTHVAKRVISLGSVLKVQV